MNGRTATQVPADEGAPSVADLLPVGVVAAIDEEISSLTRRMKITRRFDEDRLRFVEGTLAGRPLRVVRTGEGRANAALGARRLLERHTVSELIGIGFCGAISPALEPGTVLVGRRVVDGGDDLRTEYPATSDLATGAGLTPATFVTIDRMLCSAEGKRAAWMNLGGIEAAAVDMESAALARVAETHALPYVAIRVVSDTAEENLPIDFNRFIDETGRVNRMGVVAHAALRPSVIRSLWRLRGRANRCSETLADVLGRLFEGALE